MNTNRPRKKVMISSTSLDLPEHRKQVIDACLRMDCEPLPMEILGARNADAAQESLRLVDEAAIYIGIFAHRYGFIPPGYEKSITELEYDRAVERGIPRLIFFMHDEHPITAKEVETGPGAEKLKKLKERIGVARVVAFFKSIDGLRADVVQALSKLRESTGQTIQFHYVSDIPEPPEPYVAHPYVLLQSHQLVGRREELNLLTDWVAKPGSPPYDTRLFHLVAIGGQGKSALAWHWFQNVAEQEMKPLAGRLWWSFYESDASFENFVIRALAYVTRQKIEDVRQTPLLDRERLLLAILDREPYLIVFDGLERLLHAYSGQNLGQLQDDSLDEHTANFVAEAYGLPASAAQSFTGQHRLRLTADPRAGAFLKNLTHVAASRILISTRLYPADLQSSAQGEPIASCFAYFLPGLTDDDALNLWRAFGAKGSRETMLPMLRSFDKHPLLVQALASVVSHDRRAVGNFDLWREQHPKFDPFPLLNAAERKSHVLSYALRGIDERQLRLLQTVAGFRMPTIYETLVALFVKRTPAIYFAEPDLDIALADLEDRGLLGWDRRANRYDLHPIVRGVVWSAADTSRRREVFTTMHDHFAPIETKQWRDVESLDDLTAAIELFHALISLGQYEDAFIVFQDKLDYATLWRLRANQIRIELVERLFPNGIDQLPRLNRPPDQSSALNALALALVGNGKPGAALPVLRRKCEINELANDATNLLAGLANLTNTLRQCGQLRSAETSARRTLEISRIRQDRFEECVGLQILGLTLAARSSSPVTLDEYTYLQGKEALSWSLEYCRRENNQQGRGLVNACLAEVALWRGDVQQARLHADLAWTIASQRKNEADYIRAARLLGVAALRGIVRNPLSKENVFAFSHECLHLALTRVHACQYVEEELPALVGLAELHCVFAERLRGDNRKQNAELPNLSSEEHLDQARRLLSDVWLRAEDGPYPLLEADAYNILAQIERATATLTLPGSSTWEQAIISAGNAARSAYEKAWCQGPPFAYAFGLYHAKKHLSELGVPPPGMPSNEESQNEPTPDLQIGPPELVN